MWLLVLDVLVMYSVHKLLFLPLMLYGYLKGHAFSGGEAMNRHTYQQPEQPYIYICIYQQPVDDLASTMINSCECLLNTINIDITSTIYESSTMAVILV